MSEPHPSRRRFLAGSGAALAAAALGRIRAIRADVLQEAEQVAQGAVDLRGAYTLEAGVTYLNHASIGTIPGAVQRAHARYLELCETNPWLYMWGGEWEAPRDEVRRRAAELLGCRPVEVALTHNTTEAFNLLAQGLPLEPADEVLYSNLNHPGASICFQQRSDRGRYKVRRFELSLEELSVMSLDELVERHAAQIRPQTRVLVFPHIDNIVGLRHPVQPLARMARERGVEYVLVDGAQSVGMLPVDLSGMDVDAYATSPHKWLQAPKGLGLTYIREALIPNLHPMWVTWGYKQQSGTARRFEDYGTRNMPEVLALGDAIRFQQQLGDDRKHRHLKDLWRHAMERVDGHAGLEWRSPREWSLSASLFAVEVQNRKAGEVARRLFAEDGIVVRAFDDPGLNTLRVSPNLLNTPADIDRFVEAATA